MHKNVRHRLIIFVLYLPFVVTYMMFQIYYGENCGAIKNEITGVVEEFLVPGNSWRYAMYFGFFSCFPALWATRALWRDWKHFSAIEKPLSFIGLLLFLVTLVFYLATILDGDRSLGMC